MTGQARDIIRRYFERRPGLADMTKLDGMHHYEVTLLTDLCERLEVILEDNGVDGTVIGRVIREMLYGSPSPAAAEQRRIHDDEMVSLLQRTRIPVDVDAVLRDMGLPP